MKETVPEPAGRRAERQPKKNGRSEREPSEQRKKRRKTFRSKREANDWMNREAVVTLSVCVLFYLWWVLALYRDRGPKRYILGMPEWFFYGAFVGTIVFIVAVWLVVALFFRETEAHTRTAAQKKKQAAAKAKYDAEKTLAGPEGPVDWQTAAAEALAVKRATLVLEAIEKETEDEP